MDVLGGTVTGNTVTITRQGDAVVDRQEDATPATNRQWHNCP